MSDYYNYNFDQILSGIKEYVLKETTLNFSMDHLFFEWMKSNAKDLEGVGFIRYLNIFNRAEKEAPGHV